MVLRSFCAGPFCWLLFFALLLVIDGFFALFAVPSGLQVGLLRCVMCLLYCTSWCGSGGSRETKTNPLSSLGLEAFFSVGSQVSAHRETVLHLVCDYTDLKGASATRVG